MRNNIFRFIVSLIIPQLAGIAGSVFTAPVIATWYAGLNRPMINPPSWIFAPVWTTLFLLMGVSLFLVWSAYLNATEQKRRREIKIALVLFGVQLVLNTFWSILFFGFQNPGGALIEIVFLWLAIIATLVAFWRISKLAGWLLVPYLLWVSFAGYLNYALWALN